MSTPEQMTFTFDELAVSPLNVRFNEEDCQAVEALSASIVEQGLIQSLSLHPVPECADWAKPGERERALGQTMPAKYGIYAGGRRYRAIRLAIERQQLPRNFPIAARVRNLSRGEIILASLDENLQRRDLRAYEIHRAIAAAHAEGLAVDQIAAQTGQRPAWIAQQLRLGELHPEVFAAYIEDTISVDQAKAYAATDDHDLQVEAFRHFRPLARYEESPYAIRAYMKVGDAELKRLLLFVGEAIYRGHGGMFELDLFADGPDSDRGRVVDQTLLRELYNEKRAGVIQRIRAAVGEPDLRFQPHPPQFSGRDDIALELEVRGQDWEAFRIPRKASLSDIVATLEIDREGRWRPRFWWTSRKAKGDNRPADGAPTLPRGGGAIQMKDSALAQQARATVRDEYGFTADGLQVVRSTRRMLLRSVLMTDAAAGGTLGRDYLVWSQLRQELQTTALAEIGARGMKSEWEVREDEPREVTRNYLEGQEGERQWKALIAACSGLPAFKLEDPADAFSAFVDQLESEKRQCAALLAGLSLLRSAAAPGFEIAVHDRLAEMAGADDAQLRRFWKPTPTFLGLLPKLKRLELAQPHADRTAFKSWHKRDDKTIASLASTALEEQPDWIHPLLTFGVARADYGDREDEQRRTDQRPDDEDVPAEAMQIAQVPA